MQDSLTRCVFFYVLHTSLSSLQAHIEASSWKANKNVKIETRVSQSYSIGECLREVSAFFRVSFSSVLPLRNVCPDNAVVERHSDQLVGTSHTSRDRRAC